MKKGIALKKIVLYGAGGFGKEVATIIEWINWKKPTYELLGFIDDGESFHTGVMINDYPWLGGSQWIIDHKEDTLCTCTIGNASIKSAIQEKLTNEGVLFESLIAIDSFISKHTSIGQGCVIYGGVTVSVNCSIGNGVLINQGCNIGHDVIIGDYTTIMPGTGISGAVKIGAGVSIGGHAFIVPERKIGDGATVAAGSVVFTNVKAGTTVLGNPAKRMKGLE